MMAHELCVRLAKGEIGGGFGGPTGQEGGEGDGGVIYHGAVAEDALTRGVFGHLGIHRYQGTVAGCFTKGREGVSA